MHACQNCIDGVSSSVIEVLIRAGADIGLQRAVRCYTYTLLLFEVTGFFSPLRARRNQSIVSSHDLCYQMLLYRTGVQRS